MDLRFRMVLGVVAAVAMLIGCGEQERPAPPPAANAAKSAATKATEAAKDTATKATEATKATATKATEAAKDTATKATEAAKVTAGEAAKVATETAGAAKDPATAAAGAAAKKAEDMLAKVTDSIKKQDFNQATELLDTLDGIAGSLPESLQAKIDAAHDALDAAKASGEVGDVAAKAKQATEKQPAKP
jgi:hypothetical protein